MRPDDMPLPARGLRAAAAWILDAGPWRRRLGLFLAGMASVLAMAPVFASPVLFLTLPLLVAAIDRAARSDQAPVSDPALPRRRRQASLPLGAAFAAGWWFAAGYHLAGLFWIGEAFLVEAETFAVLLPFAVTLMPAGLALFWGAAAAVSVRVWRPGLGRVVVLALALAAAEWLRGHVLTGFPWNVLGYALTFPLPLMQLAGLLGIYALTLIAVLLFASPGVLCLDARAGDLSRARVLAVALVPLAGLALAGWGLLRTNVPGPDLPVPIRIVQPSVPQREKWIPANQERIFREHLALSHRDAGGREDGARGRALIIWPEAAMPFLPLSSPVALRLIAEMLPEGTYLASGALRAGEAPDARATRPPIYNSLLVLGEGGRLAHAYDKIHLVPFGEYLPLQSQLEAIGLQQLTKLRGGFATGVRPRPLIMLPGLPVLGPLVCYEAIFPGAIVQGAARPAALLNVTNDGWFGNTSGPRQHLHQARVRAVEEGLPLIRAANNGISAIIDAKGRVVASLGLDQTGVLDGPIPGATSPPLYARVGDIFFFLMLAAGVVWLAASRREIRGHRD